jgi:hypothetical protein
MDYPKLSELAQNLSDYAKENNITIITAKQRISTDEVKRVISDSEIVNDMPNFRIMDYINRMGSEVVDLYPTLHNIVGMSEEDEDLLDDLFDDEDDEDDEDDACEELDDFDDRAPDEDDDDDGLGFGISSSSSSSSSSVDLETRDGVVNNDGEYTPDCDKEGTWDAEKGRYLQ